MVTPSSSPMQALSSPFLSFSILCHLRKEPGDLCSSRGGVRKALLPSSSPLTPSKSQSSSWSAGSLPPGSAQGMFVLMCQPLSKIYSEPHPLKVFPLWSWDSSFSGCFRQGEEGGGMEALIGLQDVQWKGLPKGNS